MSRIAVIDGNSLINRAYYAMKSDDNQGGEYLPMVYSDL